MIKSGIYCIKNLVNNKVYVGRAVDFKGRFYKHKWGLNKNISDSQYLQNAWNKYGEGNFEFILLEYVKDLKDLRNREQEWTDLLESADPKFGYNIRKIVDTNLGLKHSEKTKKQMSLSTKGKNNKGKNNPMYGKHHTKEARIKMSNAHKGKCKGQNNPFYGRKHSEEAKKKISKANKGNKYCVGLKVSEKTKEKISQTSKDISRNIGENNPNAKLNPWKVRVIRQLLKSNSLNQREIAKIFNISVARISDINTKRCWKHINKEKK